MKKNLFLLSVILFFAGFSPRGWEIFLCLFLTLVIGVLTIKPGLPEKHGSRQMLLSAVISIFYAVYVFITFGDIAGDNIILTAVFTVLTTAGAFWFILNILSMLPKVKTMPKNLETADNNIGKAGMLYLLIGSLLQA